MISAFIVGRGRRELPGLLVLTYTISTFAQSRGVHNELCHLSMRGFLNFWDHELQHSCSTLIVIGRPRTQGTSLSTAQACSIVYYGYWIVICFIVFVVK